MRHPMMSVLEQNPVLPAVKDAGRLEACLAQPAGVVFLLCGDILNIDRLIDRVHQAGKYAVVHADLVAGLAPRNCRGLPAPLRGRRHHLHPAHAAAPWPGAGSADGAAGVRH